MKPRITINESSIMIPGFKCAALGKVSQKTIDLTPYTGKHVRIWLDKDKTYSLDPKKDHFWQVAELTVPEIKYQQIETDDIDDNENTAQESKPLPLMLKGTKIEKWDLPA